MNLFQAGNFTLHSGAKSKYKIDCDALSNADMQVLAQMITDMMPAFGKVIGVPRGGLRLAEYLQANVTPDCSTILLVDDVLTTGASMVSMHVEIQREVGTVRSIFGAVLFSRGPSLPWVRPLFRMPTILEPL